RAAERVLTGAGQRLTGPGRRRRCRGRRAAVLAAALVLAAGSAGPAQAAHGHARRVCSVARAGYAACNAWLSTDLVPAAAAATPSGLSPANLQAAYNLASLSASTGAGRTIAIVDAYDDPTAYNDVNVYRAQFGIPALASCTPSSINASTSACFAKF